MLFKVTPKLVELFYLIFLILLILPVLIFLVFVCVCVGNRDFTGMSS